VAGLVAADAGGPSFVEVLRRAWEAGDAVAPIDRRLPGPARHAVLRALRPTELAREDGTTEPVPGGAPVEDGDALVVATSGTTGDPRGVVLTHDAVQASATATSARIGVDPAIDRWLCCLPVSHVGGLSVVTRALLTRTPLTVHVTFDAAQVDAAATEGCTLTSLVPTALRRIDPGRWRRILLGGSTIPADRPPNTVATYGMTETASGIVYDGVPLDGVEVRVGADGEIHVRAPMLLRCYRDGTDPKTVDGWYATGDLGEVGADGLIRVHGRRGDLIVTGGEKVWPTSVERALAGHPGVADVAIVGRPDTEWGQRVVAIVVPRDGSRPPTLEVLRGAVKDQLPGYAAPRELELVELIPRTSLGKVRRTAL
jgi:o-succinylbenzoate---CoA ligase